MNDNQEPTIQSSPIKNNYWSGYLLIFLATLGLLDALYLTSRYYKGAISCNVTNGCEEVLLSRYSHFGPVPIAMFGVAYYLVIIFVAILSLKYHQAIWRLVLKFLPAMGFLFSLWLLYIQAFILKYFCQYCLLSALTSTLIFIASLWLYKKEK